MKAEIRITNQKYFRNLLSLDVFDHRLPVLERAYEEYANEICLKIDAKY